MCGRWACTLSQHWMHGFARWLQGISAVAAAGQIYRLLDFCPDSRWSTCLARELEWKETKMFVHANYLFFRFHHFQRIGDACLLFPSLTPKF